MKLLSLLKKLVLYVGMAILSLTCWVDGCFGNDGGDEVGPLTIVHFDSVDVLGDGGNWYKDDYANYDWAESYVMQAYTVVLIESGDEKYAFKLGDHIQTVLDNRNSVVRDRYDIVLRQLTPAWAKPSGKTESGDEKYYSWLVSTGMMTYPIAVFIRFLQDRPETDFSKDASERYLEAVQSAVALYDRDWVQYDIPLWEGYYKLSDIADFTYLDHVSDPKPGKRAGYPLPLNMQNALGRTLVILSRIESISAEMRAEYKNKASRLARFFKNRLEYLPETDSYRFSYAYHRYGQDEDGRYHYGEYHYGAPIEDINHASLSVDFARLCFENTIEDPWGRYIFTERDMVRFAHTFTRRIYSGQQEMGHQFYKYIDVREDPDYDEYYIDSAEHNPYVLDIGSWLPFCQYEPLIYTLVERKFAHIWKHQKNRMPNPRFLLGIANLVKYNSFRPH